MMRTFAMSLVGAGYAVISAVFLVLATQPFAADFMVIIIGFIGLFVIVGVAAVWWTGARRRAWFWLVAGLLGVVVLLFNGFYAPYALTHPADAVSFVTMLVVIVSSGVVILASLTAWREVRAERPMWRARGRAGLIGVGVLGLVVGASVTSGLAAAATSTTPLTGDVPTETAALLAKDTRFSGVVTATSGEVLGILVTNADPYVHSFDLDALGIHVPLPPSSTTFVAVKPTASGPLSFYCAVPGHKDAGMVGVITVP